MKVALVHELLTMKGGAERVLRVLAAMFPDAPIYTLLYDEQKLGDWFPKQRIRPSNLQSTATHSLLPTHRFNHHRYLSRFPEAIEAFDFSAFDLVISASSAFAHGIITNGKPKHLCYVHSPARYLWDRTHDVQAKAGQGLLGFLKRYYLSRTFHKLRIWDSEVAARPDALLAASKEVQRRIQLYWNRKSEIVYPPIDDCWFNQKNVIEPRHAAVIPPKQNKYFFIVSTLVPYKRIDLAIQVCNELHLPLKIVGNGPALSSLKGIAGPTIEFLGYKSDEELRTLYSEATATIFPGDEDFGLVPLESQACGTPVIAFRSGGALETVIDGETGAFFDAPTAESLAKILESFDHKKYSSEKCISQARNFSQSEFEQKISSKIAQLMAST